jgi:Nif-specific regulatory protein
MAKQNVNHNDLIDLVKILGLQTDAQEVLKIVAQKSSQLLKADLALILLLNPDTRETVKTVIRDGKNIKQNEYRNIHIHVGGWIIANSKSFFSKNIHKDSRFIEGLFKDVNVKSVAGAPLIIEGTVIGALVLLFNNVIDKSETSTINLIESIAAISAPFLRNSQKIRYYFESQIPETFLLQKYKNAGLFGKSPQFTSMLKSVEAATKCDARVLLIGETGTGKELIAKAIHQFSSRTESPFVAVDCGAIPETLLESELFGHTKGAFTGANSERQGLFFEANGGTLFMDEVNNLPFNMQSKLLRVLQEGEIRPVGSNKTLSVSVRVIAASSYSLKKLVKKNEFREDLFFRLHVYPIYIPNLDERKEDIPILAKYFLKKISKEQNKKIENFTEDLVDFMKDYSWKGNIRELVNFVERLVSISSENSSMISSDIFPPDLHEQYVKYKKEKKIDVNMKPLNMKMNEIEAGIIEKILADCNWNQSEAARRLGISERNIRYKIEKLNIKKNRI